MINIEYKKFSLCSGIPCKINQDEIDNFFLTVASAYSTFSTCVRRMYGLIIVKDNKIIGSGYNGDYDGCHRECTIEGECLRDLNCIGDKDKFNPCLREDLGITLSDEELKDTSFYVICMDRRSGKFLNISLDDMCIKELSDFGVQRFIIGSECLNMTKI